MTKLLKLRAEQAGDLEVISAALQDAILRVGEIRYDSQARALSLRLTRYRHEAEDAQERVLSGFRVDSILSLKSKGIDRSDPEALAVLLGLNFAPADDVPSGMLHLIFAGGGEIQARVECIDLTLADTAAPRKTDKNPLHPDTP